ncbi:GNAT superfamily N-acetyltransferase [Constrictibacter sp. MBR-5]|jgi:GNAT superfamily N-acetyltransferase|uniref:hypothetical protein n=1 Tax=Constrictibacter sp. MBR-5 TaxID=3156467 RepID=UPI0033981704
MMVPESGADADADALVVGRKAFAILTALLAAPPQDNPALARLMGGGGRNGGRDGDGPAPVPLTPATLPVAAAARFDCGVDLLNEGLRKDAAGRRPPAHGLPRCAFVLMAGDRPAGYFSLRGRMIRCAASAGVGTAGAATRAGDVPIVALSRLAVDRRDQGSGLGAVLLREALLCALGLSEGGGQHHAPGSGFAARAVFVHALEAAVRPFYLRHGLRPAPAILDPLGVLVTTTEARTAVEVSTRRTGG